MRALGVVRRAAQSAERMKHELVRLEEAFFTSRAASSRAARSARVTRWSSPYALANYGGTIAAWASYNKWALLGGLRSSSQMMSYEVAIGLALMGAFLVTGSLEPGFIASHGASDSMSGSNPLNWLWLWQPVGFLLFFTAAIAETKRAPFDIPEGEPEIIGYFVEYSGMRWGIFFLAEFHRDRLHLVGDRDRVLRGWQVPFLDADGFRIGGYIDQVNNPLDRRQIDRRRRLGRGA